MEPSELYGYNIINMKVLDIDKKKKILAKTIKLPKIKLDDKQKEELFDKCHVSLPINIDDECIICVSSCKGGYQYVFKPTSRYHICDICQVYPGCHRCRDIKNGIYNDVLKTYKNQINLCKFCSYIYFCHELEYTPVEFKTAYTGFDPTCNNCKFRDKACLKHYKFK